MPFEVVFNAAGTVAHERFTGRITVEDLLRNVDAVISHPSFGPGLALLCDLSAADVELLDVDGLRTYVGYLRRHRDRYVDCRFAILAPRDAQYGLTRMFTSLSEPLQFDAAAFRDRDEALEFLGVAASDLPT